VSGGSKRQLASGRQHLGAVETAQKTWHQQATRRGMDTPRVNKLWPVFGGLLYVVLSVRFGSVWDAALSTMMTRIGPSG
jgi:hypothetical protein